MRRWAWRAVLAVALTLLLASGIVGVRAFNRACDGSLEGLRYLSNVRAQLASATAPAPTPPPLSVPPTSAPPIGQAQPAPPTPTPRPPEPPPPSMVQRLRELVGVVGDAVLVMLIRIKQHDAVAYPAHIVAAHLLDTAGCGRDAVRLQWLKAGLHASDDRQIQYVAASLRAEVRNADDLADLRRVVRTWTERAPESVSLRRVLPALDEPKS